LLPLLPRTVTHPPNEACFKFPINTEEAQSLRHRRVPVSICDHFSVPGVETA
jgi:hypothetical protein